MLKAIVTVATVWGVTASAASFDCKSVATPRERLICATPALSDADEKLAQSYKDALSDLSPEGREAVKSGQRSWLAYLTAICPISKLPDEMALKDQTECLDLAYNARLKRLESDVQHIGPYLFVGIEKYRGVAAQSSSDGDDRPARHYNIYPRIDIPINPITIRWNEIIEDSYRHRHSGFEGPTEDSDCDNNDDYTISAATPDLISVKWDNYYYCHGTPHGYDESDVETFIMLPKPHPMAAADLFIPDVDWAARLKPIVRRKLADLVEGDESVFSLNARHAIDEVAENPRRWELTEDGIEFIFQPYELNMGRGFPGEPIIVRWSEISDLLRKDIQLH